MIFHSFGDLGKHMGISVPEKQEATKKCHKCGGEMTRVPGTNVFICGGETKDGPCNRFTLSMS